MDIVILDEMWHTFILFTNDYADFCNQFFGHYIHHGIITKQESGKQTQEKHTIDQTTFLQELQENMKSYYSFVYDTMGDETFTKWYSLYPQKYTPAYLNTVYKKWQ